MLRIDEIVKEYEISYPRLVKFYNLPDSELKDFLSKLFPELDIPKRGLYSNGSEVVRKIVNGKIDKITISFYDSIEISWTGIYLIPEHGVENKLLSLGNEHLSIIISEPTEPFNIKS